MVSKIKFDGSKLPEKVSQKSKLNYKVECMKIQSAEYNYFAVC